MKNHSVILNTGRRTLDIEAQTLVALSRSLDDNFAHCVTALHRSRGRAIVTGIGKTALVARKIVATLNSTGTAALFLHAADAIHGDLGMVQPDDTVICLSKSGETAEMKVLARLVRQLGNTLLAIVCKRDCSLARIADHTLYLPVEREADPNNLAPTASTTSQMAAGDAIAVSLLALRGFSPEDFARFHPGGSLGKRLYLRVGDLYPRDRVPTVRSGASLTETLVEMTAKCLGITAVVNERGELMGIITDGDVRRKLSETNDPGRMSAGAMLTARPKTVTENTLAVEALAVMTEHSISQLVVTDEAGTFRGFLHLHELVREGFL